MADEDVIARIARQWDRAEMLKSMYSRDCDKFREEVKDLEKQVKVLEGQGQALERQITNLENANAMLQKWDGERRVNVPSDYELNPSQKITVKCVYCREDIDVTAEADTDGNLNIGVEGHECPSEEYEDPEESKDEDTFDW